MDQEIRKCQECECILDEVDPFCLRCSDDLMIVKMIFEVAFEMGRRNGMEWILNRIIYNVK